MVRDHFIECPRNPNNDEPYPCQCGRILADLQEHAEELAFESMRDDA